MGIFWQLQEVPLITQTPIQGLALIRFWMSGRIQVVQLLSSFILPGDFMLALSKYHLREV